MSKNKSILTVDKNIPKKYLNNYSNIINNLEERIFSEGDVIEPVEPVKNIEKFIQSGGIAYLIEKKGSFVGVNEIISLQDLKKIKYNELEENSPLRALLENKQVLEKVKKVYNNFDDRNTWYVHGYGIVPEEQNTLILRDLIGIFEKIKQKGDMAFAFVKPDNIVSLKVFFRLGSMAYSLEKNVYGKNEQYLMVGFKNT